MATTRGSPGKAYLEIPGNKTAKPARLSCAGARTTSEGGAVQKKKEKEKKKKRKKDYNVTLSSTRTGGVAPSAVRAGGVCIPVHACLGVCLLSLDKRRRHYSRLLMMHEWLLGSNETMASERISLAWGEDTVDKM
ncbi:hypothetical protein KIN20_008977 [Parelaphostrongylus tenuis]|uniref:Uncharacterized protein n=1 Tax=Parelaphostrongylus tenuis TaxID=148309 RepID=A0AAD5QHX0_PARTN|nr:hypothetical protein KIN20_008977 [Parelaphostrongylus tenuis]